LTRPSPSKAGFESLLRQQFVFEDKESRKITALLQYRLHLRISGCCVAKVSLDRLPDDFYYDLDSVKIKRAAVA
jgi:hypothetical protein